MTATTWARWVLLALAVLALLAAALALVGVDRRDAVVLAVPASLFGSQWLDVRGPVGPRSRRRRRAWAVAAVLLLVTAAVLLVTDTWRTGVATAVLGLLAVSRTGPRPAGRPDPVLSQQAAADWGPERVREVVGDPGDRVRATRALRRADPRLGLADAVRLVDAAADGQQRGA